MQSVATVAAIGDIAKRAKAASRLVREAQEKADTARTDRDLAIVAMVRDFVRITGQYKAQEDEVNAAWERGEIDDPERERRLKPIRDAKNRDLAAEAKFRPVDAYRTTGVSRSLFVRIISRAPADLDPIAHPDKAARKHAEAVTKYDTVTEEARQIRDDAITTCLTPVADGGLGMSNADVARLTGLTTARIAQMRLGRR